MRVELKVKPVTRYIVTKYASEGKVESGVTMYSGGSVSTVGEYDNPAIAYEVAYAIAKSEHDRLGYPPGDERIQYPKKETPLDSGTVITDLMVNGNFSFKDLDAQTQSKMDRFLEALRKEMPNMIKNAKNRGRV